MEPLTYHRTREAWLTAAVEALTPLLTAVDAAVPPVRVSVGFPGGRGRKNAVIGQCWAAEAATDKVAQVFISPTIVDPVQVLATLLHELIHAVDANKSGHRGQFARVARAVGLQGPMTATTPGEALSATLRAVANGLGMFPHAALRTGVSGAHKPQGTRMLKVECPACGYTVRTTQKWLDVGTPSCPCGESMEAV
jgi:hypothetical protein